METRRDSIGAGPTAVDVMWTETTLHMPSNSRIGLNGQSSSGRPAVFLDRDGVIVEDVNYLDDAKKVNVLPGAARAIKSLAAEFFIVLVTNQSGIARGAFTEETLLEVHRKMVRELWDESGQIDAILYCPHLPHGQVEDYSIECPCRKPLPGMLNRAAGTWGLDLAGSHMVGDTARDIGAGHAAGVHTVLVTGQYAAEPGDPLKLNTASAADLPEAANLILAGRT